MIIKVVSEDIVKKLRSNHGVENLRNVVKYYGANIPEKYWFKDFDKETIEDCLEIIKENKNLFIVGSDLSITNLFISNLLRNILNSGKDCYRFNYAELISEYTDKFSVFNLSSFLDDIKFMNIIAIMNIFPNKFYEQTKHHFENILMSLMNSRLNKTVIINVAKFNTDDFNKEFYQLQYGSEILGGMMFNKEDSSVIEL
jgi:hypothetical protein